jgi:hypothetical protein
MGEVLRGPGTTAGTTPGTTQAGPNNGGFCTTYAYCPSSMFVRCAVAQRCLGEDETMG